MKQLKVILIGAGSRGQSYTNLMEDSKYKVVAVAEPQKAFRDYIKEKHNIPDEMCFETWEPLLDIPKCADVCVICTLDQMHHAPALKAIELGYNLLLEKPISSDVKECIDKLEKKLKKKIPHQDYELKKYEI